MLRIRGLKAGVQAFRFRVLGCRVERIQGSFRGV